MAQDKKNDSQKKGLKSKEERTVVVIDEPVKIQWQKNLIKIFKIKGRKKTGSALMDETKKDRLESKRLAKEAKILYKTQKKDQKISKSARHQELKENLDPANTKLSSKEISQETRKKIKVKKTKDKDQKFDFKQATREFPVKMIKEVNKIKWSGAENLTKKYVTVIIFMAVFALIFFFIDWGLQALFVLMKVI